MYYDMGEKLFVCGVNFRNSTLEIRNKFALTTDHIKRIYTDSSVQTPNDFFILSTCNRTEIYGVAKQADELMHLLAGDNSAEDVAKYTFVKSGDAALKHLFRVAAGLESQILGDYEIISQLKNAFVLAKSYNKTSGLVEKMVNAALQASRQVKSRTALSDGTTSISYSVIQLLKQGIDHEQPLHICLMGLGKIGTLTLKNLKHYLPQHKITLVNRNESKAESAAGEHQVNFAPFGSQQEVLQNTDILIVATGADHSIISKNDILNSPIRLIFDLSVPSNVSVDVKEIADVKVYNIDELSQTVNQAIDTRKNEIPLAESIIEEHFYEFKAWEERRKFYSGKNSEQNYDRRAVA